MIVLIYLCGGIALIFLLKYLSSFTEFSVYEVTTDMVPIDRDLLEEIAETADSKPRPKYRYQRKRLRFDLEAVQVRFRRILANAARPRDWATFDRRTIKRKRLDYGPELSNRIEEVLAAELNLRRAVKLVLIRIWMWNLTGFQRREWGPVPNLRNLRITEILRAYERLKQATIDLARTYGEAAIAEEIAAVM